MEKWSDQRLLGIIAKAEAILEGRKRTKNGMPDTVYRLLHQEPPCSIIDVYLGRSFSGTYDVDLNPMPCYQYALWCKYHKVLSEGWYSMGASSQPIFVPPET